MHAQSILLSLISSRTYVSQSPSLGRVLCSTKRLPLLGALFPSFFRACEKKEEKKTAKENGSGDRHPRVCVVSAAGEGREREDPGAASTHFVLLFRKRELRRGLRRASAEGPTTTKLKLILHTNDNRPRHARGRLIASVTPINGKVCHELQWDSTGPATYEKVMFANAGAAFSERVTRSF